MFHIEGSCLWSLQFGRGKPDPKIDWINKESSGRNKMKMKPSYVLKLLIQIEWSEKDAPEK